MAQPTLAPRKSLRGSVGCLLLLLLVVFLVGGGLILLGSRTSSAISPGPLVNILTPSSSSRAELNVPLTVNARADHSSYISRIELYADGTLAAVQASTLPGGSNPLIFIQRWIPTTTGRHVLMARAYSKNGQRADSSVVYVDVVPLLAPSVPVNVDAIPRREGSPSPTLKDIAEAVGTTTDRLREANPPLHDLDLTRPITPGTSIEIPRAPAPPPLPPGSPPSPESVTAPPPPEPLPGTPAVPTDLIAVADCTNAQLTWSDSADEEQYVVYRLAPGSSSLDSITTLAANTTTYLDALAGLGTYRYQVAAVRGGLEGLSGMAEAATPGACVPPASSPSTASLLVVIQSIETTSTFSRGVYCYYQIDSAPWEHVPDTDALVADSGNPNRYDLTSLPGRGRFILDHSEGSPVIIGLDCWGRHDAVSDHLDERFSTNHPREEWDGVTRELRAPNGSFTVRYCISTGTDGCTPATAVLLFAPYPFIQVPPIDLGVTLPTPTNLRIHGGIEACDNDEYLRTETERAACVLSFLFGGAETLYWDWSGEPRYPDASIFGYEIRVSPERGAYWEYEVRPGTRKAVLIFPNSLHCGTRVTYAVRALNWSNSSAFSDPIAYDTPPCPNEVELTVTFDKFTLGPSAGRDGVVDDGDICLFCTDRQLELGGLITVNGPDPYGENRWLLSAKVTEGSYNFIDYPGWDDSSSDVDPFGRRIPLIRERPSDNTLKFRLLPGQTVTIAAEILDYDMRNPPDKWCASRREWGRDFDLQFWARASDTLTLTDDFGEGSCNLQIRMQGRKVR